MHQLVSFVENSVQTLLCVFAELPQQVKYIPEIFELFAMGICSLLVTLGGLVHQNKVIYKRTKMSKGYIPVPSSFKLLFRSKLSKLKHCKLIS